MGTASRVSEVAELLAQLKAKDMTAHDISDNEMAKSHARYMVGGASVVPDERLFRFGTFLIAFLPLLAFGGWWIYLAFFFLFFAEFPERPGALRKFLLGLQSDWNISLWHYRNQGGGQFQFIGFLRYIPIQPILTDTDILLILMHRSGKDHGRNPSSTKRESPI